MTIDTRRRDLQAIWQSAVEAVSGEQAVTEAIEADDEFRPDQIIAVGKAAVGMCRGALNRYQDCPALVVTKYDHADDDICSRRHVRVIESAHPIPDQNSLDAGDAMLECIAGLTADSRLLLLVSGGASALAESLPDIMSLADLQDVTDDMISTGKTIGEINKRRKQMSQIKDGKLLAAFKGAEARVYAISDVEGDSIATIGSGIGVCHRATVPALSKIIASNHIARDRAAQAARKLGYAVNHNEESLYDDVFELAPSIASQLAAAEPGVYIWGGEPTVMLPEHPGRGGRNQALALAIAEYLLDKNNISLLVAGTDGSDGPTTAAGGLVDCTTFLDSDAARAALKAADAGTYIAIVE
jgi:hydroxypyruvate reductase